MSTNASEQNGRQAPSATHKTPSDPRIENLSEHQKPVCRKYVWGTCNKSSTCKFRHELVYDEMKKILKFCHDHQNKQGCARIDCSYLHTTSEEENLFLTTGQIPRVLQERYTSLCEPTNMPNFEGMPQMAMFVRAPPPPPPPPAPMLAGAALPPPPTPMLAGAALPPPPPPPPPQHLPSFTSVQPPPPPPPPPATTQQTPMFSAPPPQQTPIIFPINQPPPAVPPIFDASRPPPPLPKNIGKRRLDHDESSSNKLRKGEDCKIGDCPCGLCIQREIRIEIYKQQMEKLQAEEEYQLLMNKKKLDEIESGKEVLRSLVGPQLYRILNEYIEGGPPQMQDFLSQFQSSFITGTSTVPKQFLLQLMEYVFNNPRDVVDPPMSPPQLSSFSLRSSNTTNSSTSGVVQALLEVLRNSTSSSEALSIDGNKSCSPVNGFHINNGQKNESASASGLNANRYVNSGDSMMYQSAVGPSGIAGHAAPVVGYPPYQPSMPPPPPANRPPPRRTAYMNPNASPQAPVRMTPSSSTSSNRPPAPSINQYNVMGNYPPSPGPHFYHPFQ